jgi:hypothetical protein
MWPKFGVTQKWCYHVILTFIGWGMQDPEKYKDEVPPDEGPPDKRRNFPYIFHVVASLPTNSKAC